MVQGGNADALTHEQSDDTYVKSPAIERELPGRENVLAAVKHWARALQVRLAVDHEHVLKNASVDDWRHIGRDRYIIVVHVNVGQLRDLEEIGSDLNRSAQRAGLGTLDNVGKVQGSHGEWKAFGGLLSLCMQALF